ncbi:MAG TPA: DUF1573 domain-containing protein [Phycisphaerae bacterium]|nr:DUF1573 domain-containing protein [Phycisphaerae bacterium]
MRLQFALLSLVICLAGQPAISKAADIHWDMEELSINVSAYDGYAQGRMTFKNVGSQSHAISRILPSCGCTSAVADKKIYQPSEKGEIVIKGAVGDRRGSFKFTALVEMDDGSRTVLTLKVNAPKFISLDPGYFLWKRFDSPKEQSMIINIVDKQGFRIIAAKASSQGKMVPKLIEIEPKKLYKLVVRTADTDLEWADTVFLDTDIPTETGKKTLEIYGYVRDR